MGNFSIGDYFKKEVIEFGFEFLISLKYFDILLDKFYMIYYLIDVEVKNIWLKLGVKEDYLIFVEGNFWEIGVGLLGLDIEIFFDRGIFYDLRGFEFICDDIENEWFIEIWNIVFL